MSATPQRHYTVKEFEDLLRPVGLGRQAIYKMIAAGDLPHVRVGAGKKLIRIPQSAVDKLLAEYGCGPEPAEPQAPFARPASPLTDTLAGWARRYGCHPQTLRRWIDSGAVHLARVSRQRYAKVDP